MWSVYVDQILYRIFVNKNKLFFNFNTNFNAKHIFFKFINEKQ